MSAKRTVGVGELVTVREDSIHKVRTVYPELTASTQLKVLAQVKGYSKRAYQVIAKPNGEPMVIWYGQLRLLSSKAQKAEQWR
jgi:hypothetical protein